MNQKKIGLFGIAILFCLSAWSQFKVIESEAVNYKMLGKPTVYSFAVEDATYFVVKQTQSVYNTFDLLKVEADGDLTPAKELKFDVGTFKNMNDLNAFQAVGNQLYALVENRNKEDGLNTLTIREVDNTGIDEEVAAKVGAIPYTKMIDPGTWLSYVTPDRQHLAIVAVYPKEKEQPQKGKYYFLDASLKLVTSGDISIGNEKKKNYAFQLLASNAGDFYLINDEFDKSYRFPVVYTKKATEKTFTEFPCVFNDPIRNFNYKAAISPEGQLVLGGYTQPKQGFRVGDVVANGIWIYHTQNPTTINTLPFDKGITNLKVSNLYFNQGAIMMVGEQVAEERENRPAGSMSFEENYQYKFGDIVVTGYSPDANSKFDISLNRTFNSRNIVNDLYCASGIIHNKLTVVYNDDLRKYVQNSYSYKVPVSANITAEGLLEQPAHYEKEFKTGNTGFNMLSQYSSASDKKMVVLLYNGQSFKAATFE